MGNDLARISYDRTRGYRSVIAQQGRVTLEADSNEAGTIASETLRHETIDIVGPAGTPDDGYAIGAGAGGPTDLVSSAGTMYLGGWRLTEARDVHLDKQPDWLNLAPDQPDWKNLPPNTQRGNNRLIALLATEQSVSAVEDTALREVALGGPDTAARSRLMQHFLTIPVAASTCADAAKELIADLAFNGLTLNAKTFEVTCGVKLQVSFFPPPVPADPCCPPAAGGYLGADNQLVRITIASYDPVKQSGTLLWGWNNASFLYRANVAVPQTASQPATLTLSPAPVDAAHTPQQGQAIEVLRTECVLSDIKTAGYTDQNFIAAAQGQAMVLPMTTSSFNADLNQLVLPGLMPPDYASEPHSLFVRLWQAEVPFTSGQSVQLDSVSGLAVTVTVTAPGTALPSEAFVTATPYWQFAVRPNTPEQVYPVRYLEAAQPPDGPRQWLCDLAVVNFNSDGFKLLEDCRRHFLPLIDQVQSTCCGVVLGPEDVIAQGGMQAVLTAAAANQTSVSLRPGTYLLPAPLALTSDHDGLTLEGCGAGAVLRADPNALSAFRPGLITITGATGISLRRMALIVPRVPLEIPTAGADTAAFRLLTLCGIRITEATSVTIEDCTFGAAVAVTNNVLGTCVYAEGLCNGLALRRNTFNGGATGTPAANVFRFVTGLFQIPAATGTVAASGSELSIASPVFRSVNQQLDNAEIVGNVFNGLTIATLVMARLGLVRCVDNRVVRCCGGLWFVESAQGSGVAAGRRALSDEVANNANASLAGTLRVSSQHVLLANAMTYAGLLGTAAPATAPPPLAADARNVLEADFTARGSGAYAELSRGFTVAARQAAPPAATATAQAAATGTNSVAGAASAASAAGARATSAAVAGASTNARVMANVDPVVVRQTTEAFGMISAVSVAVEQIGTQLQPTLYLLQNDLELAPALAAADTKLAQPSLPGLVAVCAQGAVKGSLFFQGNRVEVPTTSSIAMVSFWAAKTVIMGNQFFQLPAESGADMPCAIAITDRANFLAIMGNIVHLGWLVYPPRDVTAAADTWEFLNTVG